MARRRHGGGGGGGQGGRKRRKKGRRPRRHHGIATTFWGQAWCRNLESYSDFRNRLSRGRAYLKEGSVQDLVVRQGRIEASVFGTWMYDVSVRVKPISRRALFSLKQQLSGRVDTMVDLMRGTLSEAVLRKVVTPRSGLFPRPKEIALHCSCPDRAWMCKHVAAVLYAVAQQFDRDPRLFFELRGIDDSKLVQPGKAARRLERTLPRSHPDILVGVNLEEIFGIELFDPTEDEEEDDFDYGPEEHDLLDDGEPANEPEDVEPPEPKPKKPRRTLKDIARKRSVTAVEKQVEKKVASKGLKKLVKRVKRKVSPATPEDGPQPEVPEKTAKKKVAKKAPARKVVKRVKKVVKRKRPRP